MGQYDEIKDAMKSLQDLVAKLEASEDNEATDIHKLYEEALKLYKNLVASLEEKLEGQNSTSDLN